MLYLWIKHDRRPALGHLVWAAAKLFREVVRPRRGQVVWMIINGEKILCWESKYSDLHIQQVGAQTLAVHIHGQGAGDAAA